jgi:hypothetical protein
MRKLVVLVTGGRKYEDKRTLFRVLDEINPSRVIHGDAQGADRLAGLWCKSRKRREIKCPANWTRDGLAAGPIRNRKMLKKYRSDINRVVAFPGGRGTADCVRQARLLEIRVQIVRMKG